MWVCLKVIICAFRSPLRSCVRLSIAIMSQLQVSWFHKSMYNCIFCVGTAKNCTIYEMFMFRVIIVLYQLLLCMFVCTRERIVEVESASLSRPDWSFLLPLSAASCYSIVQVRNIAASQLCKYATLYVTKLCKNTALCAPNSASTQHYCYSIVQVRNTLCYLGVKLVYLPSCTASLLLWPSDQV